MGSHWARIQTWDGKKWNFTLRLVSRPTSRCIRPMVKAAAEKYAAEKKLDAPHACRCQS